MANPLLLQLLTLSIFTLFMGFCFCDGFKLSMYRKLMWFVPFLIFSITILKIKGQFDLTLILPPSILLAILLCWYELRTSKEDTQMNNMAFKIAGAIFMLVAAAHFLRAAYQIQIIIGNYSVPVWVSLVGGTIALLLAIWIFKSIK